MTANRRTLEQTLDLFDRGLDTLLQSGTQALQAVQELSGFTRDWRRLTGEIAEWESEAAEARAAGGPVAEAVARTLEACARRARDAITTGGES